MIARGSMVVLKGHHLTPMVVIDTVYSGRTADYRQAEGHNAAQVVWLDTFGVPHTMTFLLVLLEEIDG